MLDLHLLQLIILRRWQLEGVGIMPSIVVKGGQNRNVLDEFTVYEQAYVFLRGVKLTSVSPLKYSYSLPIILR